ncbi:MAG: tetratricopeptide repeat protein, partial [Ferruginibacter sp.]
MKFTLTALAIFCFFSLFAQQSDSVTYYFNKAETEKTQRLYSQASRSFERAIAFDSAYLAAYLQNAYVQLAMKRMDAAIYYFTKVHELDPGNAKVSGELMQLYYNYRQLKKATEFAKKCNDCPGASKVLGMSYYRQDDYPKAEKALLKALQQDSSDAEVTYTLARSYYDMELPNQAVTYYEKAVLLDPKKSNWYNELGLLQFNQNNYKKAVEAFTLAAEKGFKVDNDFNENLGYAMLYNGDYNKGEQLILGVWQIKPGNKELLRDLSELLYRQKQYD